MSYRFSVEHAGRAIRVVPDGKDDLPTTLALIRELHERLAPHPDARVLVDVRAGEYHPSPEDAQRIAREIASPAGLAGRHVALLTETVVGYGLARMVSLRTEIAGGSLSVFNDPARAEVWLAGGPEDDPDDAPG